MNIIIVGHGQRNEVPAWCAQRPIFMGAIY